MQNLNGLRHHTQRNNPQKTTGHSGMDMARGTWPMGVARGFVATPQTPYAPDGL